MCARVNGADHTPKPDGPRPPTASGASREAVRALPITTPPSRTISPCLPGTFDPLARATRNSFAAPRASSTRLVRRRRQRGEEPPFFRERAHRHAREVPRPFSMSRAGILVAAHGLVREQGAAITCAACGRCRLEVDSMAHDRHLYPDVERVPYTLGQFTFGQRPSSAKSPVRRRRLAFRPAWSAPIASRSVAELAQRN